MILAFFGAVMLVLTHTAQNSVRTTEILPGINPDPVYVTCEEGESLEVFLQAKEDFTISGFQVLLVNMGQDSRGTLRFVVTDPSSEIVFSQTIPVETVTPGKWFLIAGNAAFTAGQEYKLSVMADSSSPYFMQVPAGEGDKLPFVEQVYKEGKALEWGISLGVNRVEQVKVTYGEIFYYSIPTALLAAVILLLFLWAGKERVFKTIGRIPFGTFIKKYGNDLFLLLLFVSIDRKSVV